MRLHYNLRTKLVLLVALSVGLAELVGSLFSVWHEVARYASVKHEALFADARVLATSVARPLSSGDQDGIYQTLRSIGDIKGLSYVGVFDARGNPIADLGATERLLGDLELDETSVAIPLPSLLSTRSIQISVPVVYAGTKVGRLKLLADASDLADQLAATLLHTAIGLAIALTVALGIALRLQAAITRPLIRLTQTMDRVRASHDYSMRLVATTDDEIGVLIGGFNEMLGNIKDRDERLADSHHYLERQVAERTVDLREAKNQADAANEQKSAFLATMSHEIRTPMNGMLVMAELLAKSELPTRARRYADVIARSGQSLLAIINDILDFSKIEAGKLELEVLPMDPGQVVSTVLDLFNEKARSKALDLAARVAVDVPRTLLGDTVRINQIIGNFVNNALKFTEVGGVYVEVELDPHQIGFLRFSVRDTGIGIPEDKIGSIFGAFSQADQSTTRRFGGTGLGLAICERLVTAMGSRIQVSSEVGVGSTFSFSILITEEGAAPAWPHFALSADAKPAAILHVDGRFSAQAAGYYLGAAGLEVRPLDITASEHEFVGCKMALIEATALTPGLAEAARTAGCRLIELAAANDSEPPTGAVLTEGRITRPLSRPDIEALLASVRDGRTFESAGPSASYEALPHFAARILVADDNIVNREVAQEALEQLGCDVILVADGAEAVAMFETDKFDLVLMDGSMPVLDGFEASRQIRALEDERGLARTPIVALTAHVIGSSATAWSEAGMDAILHKPFTMKAVAGCLSELIGHRVSTCTVATIREEPIKPRLGVIEASTISELQRLAASGRPDFVARVVGLYVKHAPEALADIAAHSAGGKLEALAKSAHALKSMSLNIGARDVGVLAARIEAQARDGHRATNDLITDLEGAIEAAHAELRNLLPLAA